MTCGFCHGLPVQDAAEWSDGKSRGAVACPRCGEISTGGNVSEPKIEVAVTKWDGNQPR